MQPAGKLPLQPWMTTDATRAVMAALTGGGTKARFVGGCVRDAVLGHPVQDVDVATADSPETVLRRLQAAGIKAIPTGIEHGTITAVTGDRAFEITTLRKDVETMGRKARVAFTDDWVADAERRDFTLNALYCDPDGTLYDPTGGLDDLHARRVRFVGDAARRIQEDYLRILRFFRIYAHYGRPPPDTTAMQACRQHARGLAILSAERVAHELLRLLAAPDPATVLRLMEEAGVLAEVLPEARDLERLAALTRIDADDPSPVRRLAAASRADPVGARAMAERLRLANRDRDRLVAAATAAFRGDLDATEARRQRYRLGAEAFGDQVYLRWAEAGGRAGEARFLGLLEIARAWTPPAFPLGGADAMALGLPAGPEVGRLLRAVEDWWVEGDFRAGRDELRARLRAQALR